MIVTSGILTLTLKDMPLNRAPSVTLPVGRTPTPSRAAAELSRTGHLAYWRAEPTGGASLAVQNLDGSLRQTIAQVDDVRLISKTRWNADGNAISYIDAGAKAVVIQLDGRRVDLPLPGALVAEGRRIVDLRWSPSGMKIAATIRHPQDGRSDVWIGKVGDRPAEGAAAWSRATQLDDATARDWLDDERLLLQTAGGVVAILKDGTINALRPITGLQATSPIVGTDGRIYFLGGRASSGGGDTEPVVLVTGALWSSYADGTDPRFETALPAEGLRLDARWPNGTLLVRRGPGSAQALLRQAVFFPLPSTGGTIERVALAVDQKSAIGFTAARVVKLDLSRPERVTSTVLLDGVVDADAWFPATTKLATAPAATPAVGPSVRYAALLGASVWTMTSDGVPSLLRAAPAVTGTRRAPAQPIWSPSGTLLLGTEPAQALGNGPAVPVVIDRNGKATRIEILSGVGRSLAWSPEGDEIAAVITPAGANAALTEDLQIRFAPPDGGGVRRAAIPGREVAWSKAGLFALSNGTFKTDTRARADMAIERIDGLARRPLITIGTLLADPRSGGTGPITAQVLTDLTASPDGSFVSVRLTYQTPTPGATPPAVTTRTMVATIRVSDGRPTFFTPTTQSTADQSWSPARPLLGSTMIITAANAAPTILATVIDAGSSDALARTDGRFAGWSPDGAWFYVARDAGLFAQRVGSSETVRISSIGVPVSTTGP